jgi:hypothetical protein
MEISNDGLTLWYGTPDAPITARAVTIGARPPHPGNAVIVQYRVDGGRISSVRAAAVSPLSGQAHQYFRAALPDAMEPGHLEVLPMLSCSGRQAPGPGQAGPASSLWLPAPAAPPMPTTRVHAQKKAAHSGGPRFSYDLEFLGAVSASLLKPPETVGATPQGIRKNFMIQGGACVGPRINAKIRPSGGDWLLIQRDGVGLPSVRTTWETDDGAVLYADYYGIFDLGEQGYDNALRDRFPDSASVQLAPRFMTDHPRYSWINRLQCLGVGNVDMVNSVVDYDLYAVRGGLSFLKERAP